MPILPYADTQRTEEVRHNMLLQDNICLYRQHNKFMHLPHFSTLRMESCSLVSKDPFVLIG